VFRDEMEAAGARLAAGTRLETLLAIALAGAAATAVVAFAPPGGDSAAHLYRTELLRDGVELWDNLWYGGQYPFASYSLLYYPPAALLGNVLVGGAAVVASAALFTSIAWLEWGEAARWPARIFAVLAAGPLFTGTYTYAVGLAAALAALRLLQAQRPLLALVAAAAALGCSPLAFAFLVVALLAVLAARRSFATPVAPVAAGVVALAGAQAAVITLFPSEGRYPFSPLSLAALLGVSTLGAALAFRSDRGRLLGAFFVVWAVVGVVAFVVPSPFGDNLTRLRGVVFPLMLVASALAGFRPRWLALGALAFAFVYNLGPDVSALPKRIDDARTAKADFWAPAVSFLEANASADHRVEVVPTFGHWEAYWIPRAGFPLARGWYRQLDIVTNPELYRSPLEPAAYRAWLHRMAVRYVLLPDARLGAMGAEGEAELLRFGRAGVVVRAQLPGWTVYEVPDATPLLTGPGRARVETIEHERVVARFARAGTYHLRVRHTPYWSVATGDACVEQREDGTTAVTVREPGRVELAFAVRAPDAACGI
jgi:hypothetical protein